MNIDILKKQSEIVQSKTYKELKNIQLEMILGLANSNIDPVELKGMLKLIAKTDSWQEDYNKELKKMK